MWTQYLGIAGMVLIILAWLPQTVKVLREKRTSMPALFSAIYSLASVLLTAYAISIGDLIFTLLNFLAFLQALINLRYAL